MKISIAICTHNEGHYVHDLLARLVAVKQGNHGRQYEYEIVVVDDFSTDPTTVASLIKFKDDIDIIEHRALNGDYAAHKNYMNSLCTGDWILNLDADEFLTYDFLDVLPLIITSNPTVDAYTLPRINTVDGLTLDHVRKWGWVLTTLPGFTKVKTPTDGELALLRAYNLVTKEDNGYVFYEEPIIQWPDPQMRLYRNLPQIKWHGAVHETLGGFDNWTRFPMTPEYAIRHFKEIDRQERQNDYYATLTR